MYLFKEKKNFIEEIKKTKKEFSDLFKDNNIDILNNIIKKEKEKIFKNTYFPFFKRKRVKSKKY